MNFVSKIKLLMNRRKTLSLNPGSEASYDLGATVKLITIDMIDEILKNKEKFKEFLNPKENTSYFGQGVNFNTYATAVNDYMDFFLSKSVIFDKEVLKRASIITGKKFKNNKPKQNENYSLTEIKQNSKVLNLGSFGGKIQSLTSKKELPKQNKGQSKYMIVPYDIDENTKINPNFEKLVMSHIPKDISDKGKLAYEIYKALCLCVQYDSTYFIKKGEENSEEFISGLLDKDISEVDEKNNKIVCSTFSKLYCYFLQKNGFDRSEFDVIANKTKQDKQSSHQYVRIKADDDTILADGTNAIFDKTNGTNMSDITRIKLGLKPANFISKNGKDYTIGVKEKDDRYCFQNDIYQITNMILETQDKNKSVEIKNKLEIMKTQLKNIKNSNLGDLEIYQYMICLFTKLLLVTKDKNILGISKSIYMKKSEKEYSFYPIIYLKKSDKKYAYYVYDKENGLKGMSTQQLKGMIDSGLLNRTKGKEHNIPGLSPDEIEHSL